MARFSIVAHLLCVAFRAHYSISFTAAIQNTDKFPPRATTANDTLDHPPTNTMGGHQHAQSSPTPTDKIQPQAGKIEELKQRGPLVVDVLSVKEYPREILIDLLPEGCDIMCTHPMFGPDSGKNGWHGLNFVYERTRVDGVILDSAQYSSSTLPHDGDDVSKFVEKGTGKVHSVHENSESHIESIDRMERFLSIWEEEGCRMVELSCKDHDAYAANSQFLTHLMGRILGEQGLAQTPIDTKGFENVLKLVETTTADSFDLFYGLYKYNQNSADTIIKLKASMDGVVTMLKEMEEKDMQVLPKIRSRL